MKPITYITGDITNPLYSGVKIIAHCCNDLGKMGSGVALALCTKWESVRSYYITWSHSRNEKAPFALGEVQFVNPDKFLWIANIIGQHGIKTGSNGVPVRYDAIRKGLATVADKAKELGASVHLPRIGSQRAGGKWEIIERIIQEELCAKDLTVYVYTLPSEVGNF